MITVVIGCVNVGIKRINALQEIPEIEIVGLVEINAQQQKYLKKNFSYPISKDYKKYLNDTSIDSFIISAPTHPALKIIEAPARDYQEVLAGRADVHITSNVEAATLVDKYSDLMIIPVKEPKFPTPLAWLAVEHVGGTVRETVKYKPPFFGDLSRLYQLGRLE